MKKDQSTQSPSLFNATKVKPKSSRYRKSNAVKLLEAIADQAARTKYPNVPYLAPRTFRDDTANRLTQCVIDFLRLSGHQAERVSTTGRMIDRRQTFEDVTGRSRTIGRATWIPGTGTNGSADISATIAGKSVKIEVKFGPDRQSQAQKDYQQAIETAGGVYFIARTFDHFFAWYNLNFSSYEKR